MQELLWKAIERTTTGQLMTEEKFETELFPTAMADVQKKYGIEWDPDEPVMIDPDMADAVFKAGKELLLEVGLICKDTNRIVKFTEEEIEQAILGARGRTVTLGSGREAVSLSPRAPGDKRHPYCFNAAGIITTDTDLYKQHAMTVMQEPTCDGVIPMPLFGVNGLKNIAETPAQTHVCLTEARIMNEAAAWAGKPGLFFGIPMTSTTPHTLISTFTSGLYNKHNCTLPVQIIQDMRIDYDRFNLAYHAYQNGLTPWISSSPTLYAYITGPEQGAIQIIAHTLGMLAYAGAGLVQAMSVTVNGVYTGNDINWCNSAAALAAEQNLQLPWVSFGGTDSEFIPLCDDHWYGVAEAAITACISGMEGTWLSGGHTGLEARWIGEMSRAATELTPQEGRELMKKLNKLRTSVDQDPSTRTAPLSELYDLSTMRPKQVFIDHYKRFTKILLDLGLDYPTWHY